MPINSILGKQVIYINDNDFIWNHTNYEHDKTTDRYYRLEPSCSLRAEMDGALVKHRISKVTYTDILRNVKDVLGI